MIGSSLPFYNKSIAHMQVFINWLLSPCQETSLPSGVWRTYHKYTREQGPVESRMEAFVDVTMVTLLHLLLQSLSNSTQTERCSSPALTEMGGKIFTLQRPETLMHSWSELDLLNTCESPLTWEWLLIIHFPTEDKSQMLVGFLFSMIWVSVGSFHYLLCIVTLFGFRWLYECRVLTHPYTHTHAHTQHIKTTLSVISIFTTDTDTPLFSEAAKRQCAWQSTNRFPVTLHW